MNIKARINQLYFSIIDSKLLRIMKDFDKQITRNLVIDDIEMRPSSSNGLWCCLLLPTILLLYSLLYKVSLLYKIMTCISIGFLFYCLLFIVFLSVSCLVLKENIYGGCGAASIVSTLLLYSVLDQSFIFSGIFSTSALLLFSVSLKYSMTMFPKTFTVGEAMVVIQGIWLFIITTFTRMFYFYTGDRSDSDMEFVLNINMTVLSSVGIIVTALIIMEDEQRTFAMLCYVISVTGVYALMLLHCLIGFHCLILIASYIFLSVTRVQLFLFWTLLALLAATAIMLRMKMAVKATTVTRKVFHILASGVFLSGILIDVYFMTLAAGCGLGLIVLIEAFRKSNIEKITPVLEEAFKIYSDEKDAGYFAMTPIYLYVGLACPLILVPKHAGYELELLSGVLSLGIGDTAASWFGSKYGFNKWSGGQKTFEGTVFNIVTQIATVYIIDLFGLLQVEHALLRTTAAAIITSYVEARTEQIDNLILPLLSIISFQVTNVIGIFFH